MDKSGQHWVLTGSKPVVVAAPIATHLLIAARTDGQPGDRHGISLFLTEFDPSAPPPGMQIHSYRTIDDRLAADLIFDDMRTARRGTAGTRRLGVAEPRP